MSWKPMSTNLPFVPFWQVTTGAKLHRPQDQALPRDVVRHNCDSAGFAAG